MLNSDRYLSTINALSRINEGVDVCKDIYSALEIILNELVELLSPNAALIGIINEDTQQIDIQISVGLPEKLSELPLRKTIMAWTAFQRQATHVLDFRKEKRFTPIYKDSQSAIAFPMIIEHKVIGIVNLEFNKANDLSEQDLTIAHVICNEASKAVSKFWLSEQLENKTFQLQSLIELSEQLVATLDRNTILMNLTKEARSLIGGHASALFLFAKNQSSLELHTWLGHFDISNQSHAIDPNDSAIGGVLRRPKQIEIHDILYTEDNDFNEVIKKEGLQSMLVTPIIFQEQVIGVINIYFKLKHRFSNDEKKVSLALADLGAISLENARLYEKTFKSEEILRKNEKLTTLGLLSAEIAHEIRNPLTVIKLLFQTLDLKFEANDPRTKDSELITERIQHLEKIVERVLGFSNINQNTKSQNCLYQLTEESLQLVRLKLSQQKISVSVEMEDEEKLLIHANKGQIQQVILNLILNASQAIPKTGGTISISLYSDSKNAYFKIQDNGHGIPEEIKAQIFESFLTNRTEGTGLGLSISKGILASHQGEIHLVHSDKNGTTFEFSLPL